MSRFYMREKKWVNIYIASGYLLMTVSDVTMGLGNKHADPFEDPENIEPGR